MNRHHNKYKASTQRGQALVVALALVLCLTLLVAATQLQVVSQLGLSLPERDYERALQMAEAGANAYLNLLSQGTATPANPSDPADPAKLIPPSYHFTGTPPTLDAFRAGVKSGTYPLIRYPAGSEQGYFAGEKDDTNTPEITIIAYGWSHGVVRRVQAKCLPRSAFDWPAIYGIDNLNTNQDDAWTFHGSASVVGACGAEGRFQVANSNVTIYDGPLIWARGCYASPFNNLDLTIEQSLDGTPKGHEGTGTVANPRYRHYSRSLNIPTADMAANEETGSGMGVAYFKTHNDNATGLRYLAQNTTTMAIRELKGKIGSDGKEIPYQVLATGDYRLDSEFKDSNIASFTDLDPKSEQIYGIRAYPGNYYIEQIAMQSGENLYLRTFSDAERATLSKRAFVVQDDPPNPNPNQAANATVSFWIGSTGTNDPNSTFYDGTMMEYPNYASRFRVLCASHGDMTVHGKDSATHFRVNILCYNRDASGNGYGHITFNSNTYLYGALLAWKIDVAGGVTIERQSGEVSPGVRLTYAVVDWTELP